MEKQFKFNKKNINWEVFILSDGSGGVITCLSGEMSDMKTSGKFWSGYPPTNKFLLWIFNLKKEQQKRKILKKFQCLKNETITFE